MIVQHPFVHMCIKGRKGGLRLQKGSISRFRAALQNGKEHGVCGKN